MAERGVLARVAFVPFSARLLGESYDGPTAVAIYSGNRLVIGAMLFTNCQYATRGYRLVDETTDSLTTHLVNGRILIAPVCYLIAILVSFASPIASLVLFVAVPGVRVLGAPLDRLWLAMPFAPVPRAAGAR